MALTSWSSANYLERLGTVYETRPFMFSAWGYVTSSPAGAVGIVEGIDANNLRRLQLGGSGEVQFLERQAAGNFTAGVTVAPTNGWFHFCGSAVSATSRESYLNAANKASEASSCTPSAMTKLRIGITTDGTLPWPSAGGLAEATIWDLSGLTTVERDALALKLAKGGLGSQGGNPLNMNRELSRPWRGKLIAYWPLLTKEDLRDYSGNGFNVAMTGTLTNFSSHPRIEPLNRSPWSRWDDSLPYWIGGGAAAAYTLDLAAGSYAISGAALTPLADRALNLAAGAYALSGAALTPLAGRALNLQSGSYVLSGAALTALAARTLDLGAGGYTLTGAALSTLAGRGLDLQSGSYAITGADAFFTKGFFLNLQSGTYTITGAALTPLADRVLNLGAGSYVINGAALTPLAGRSLNLDPGVYQVTGAALTPLAGRAINLDSGSYIITGADITLVYSALAAAYELNLAPGTYLLTGADLSTVAGRMLNLQSGVYSLTGADLTVLAGRGLSLDAGVYTLTGSDLVALANRTLTLDAGVYAITGADLEMLLATLGHFALELEPGVYLISGADLTRAINEGAGGAVGGGGALLNLLTVRQ